MSEKLCICLLRHNGEWFGNVVCWSNHCHKANILTAIRKLPVFPTGNDHPATTIDIHICGAWNLEEDFLMSVKSCAIGREIVPVDFTASPIAGVGAVAEGFGPAGVVIKHAAAA